MNPKVSARSLTRRAAVGGLSALGAAAVLRPTIAHAQEREHRFNVGAAEITVLSDGTMAMPFSWVLPDREPAQIAAVFQDVGRSSSDASGQTLQVNVALIRIGRELILVDSGAGPDFAPQRGKLTERMANAGIAPEAITQLIFTHAHPDHFWGAIDPLDGGPLFAKARHFMPVVERDYWLQPGIEASMPEAVRGAALGTQRRLKELGDRIETYKVGVEVAPGITALDTAGHTPGHVSLLLQSGSSRLLIGGDVLTDAALSFARPDWRWGAGADADQAIAARKRMLDLLATDKIPLLAYHVPWPGLGRVERSGAAYRFVAS